MPGCKRTSERALAIGAFCCSHCGHFVVCAVCATGTGCFEYVRRAERRAGAVCPCHMPRLASKRSAQLRLRLQWRTAAHHAFLRWRKAPWQRAQRLSDEPSCVKRVATLRHVSRLRCNRRSRPPAQHAWPSSRRPLRLKQRHPLSTRLPPSVARRWRRPAHLLQRLSRRRCTCCSRLLAQHVHLAELPPPSEGEAGSPSIHAAEAAAVTGWRRPTMPLPGPLRLRLRRAPPLHQHRRRLRLQPPARRSPRSRGRCFARRWMSASVSRRPTALAESELRAAGAAEPVPASVPPSPAFSGDAPAADSVARNLADDMESLELVAPYVWLLPGMLVFGTQGARRGQLGQLVSVKAVDSFDAPRAAELHTHQLCLTAHAVCLPLCDSPVPMWLWASTAAATHLSCGAVTL